MRDTRQSRRQKWKGLSGQQVLAFVADDLDLHDEMIDELRRTAQKAVYAVMVAAVSFAGQLLVVIVTLKGH